MTLDWDGKIRMDCSSPYAMASLIAMKDQFDVAFACDTDHDRHGIVAPSVGLLNPNHYLAVAIDYLFRHRPGWRRTGGRGQDAGEQQHYRSRGGRFATASAGSAGGFKWFVDGLLDGSLGFGGEESAGASFLQKMDHPGAPIKMGSLWACFRRRLRRNRAKIRASLQGTDAQFGDPVYERIDAPANAREKEILQKLSPEQVPAKELAGEKIEAMLTKAPGNGAALGGLKVVTKNGWFAARPSGTEDVYKIYAESFLGKDHLRRIQDEARGVISKTFASAGQKESA